MPSTSSAQTSKRTTTSSKSARKVRTTLSVEERRERAEQLQGSIADQVQELRDSAAWVRFLNFSRAFHNYSLNNVLLILSQNPDASHVAGFRKWQELGRQVRKGERALKIFGFRQTVQTEGQDGPTSSPEGLGTPTRPHATTAEGTEQSARVLTFFPLVSVFDISQTDLVEGAEDASNVARALTGDDEHGIFAATCDYLTSLGWVVSRGQTPTGVNGYTTTDGTRQVVIGEALSPAQAAKTALHEAAHVLLHITGDQAADAAHYIAHRGLAETEAESVAYTVAGILGLDTADYTVGYIASWSQGDTSTIKATAARVLQTVHQLTDALTSTATESTRTEQTGRTPAAAA